ncbi:MAG: DUF493 domain-containing protein [bacterium]|nr:DUF493 domain-containing protein [bacterium]
MRKIQSKPEICYPAKWQYTLIGTDETTIREVVSEVLGAHNYTLTLSNNSATGKYCSLSLSTTVLNEAHRLETHHALLSNSNIKMVL